MNIDDGGPAFPTTPVSHGYPSGTGGLGTGCGTGMTLRDYFAAAALQGTISNPNAEIVARPAGACDAEIIAGAAYAFADAMLKVRGQ